MKIPYELPRDWNGERVFIIGGGPSVEQVYDWYPIISKERVIVVNDSFLLFPSADMLFFGDGDWFEDNKEEINQFNGQQILTRCVVREEWLAFRYKTIPFDRVGRNMSTGLSHNPGAVAGWCSGSNAINVAYLKGAREAILIGFDMKGGNWHNRHKAVKKPDCYTADFMPHLNRMADALVKDGSMHVINTCMDSALNCFDKMPLNEVLS